MQRRQARRLRGAAEARHVPAHITEHVTLALQNEMGFDVGYGRARGTGETGAGTRIWWPPSRPRCPSWTSTCCMT
ncbi:cyanophycin synthetase family protein [Cystobacter fuscus]